MVIRSEQLRNLDYQLLLSVVIICVAGILAINSATQADPHAMDYVRKQAAGVVVGLVIVLAIATREYQVLIGRVARYLYPINLVLLSVVLVSHFSHSSHGAQRWISVGPIEIQPSEFAKIILICTLALFLTREHNSIRTWSTVLKSLVHIGLPMLLIFKQPDLGTALVLLAIWFGMMAIAGSNIGHLLAVLAVGIVLFAGMWHYNVIHQYQKDRLEVFVNPGADPQDTGYHLHQSEIAIGSGGFAGEGYGLGTESNGKFIPEQHTDFIFTIVGEEGGFIGCVLLLALYLLALERGVRAMAGCDDLFGRLLAAGILSMLTFHIVVNAGMTMGIMPVVGVPLPCFSYGLSSLLVNLVAFGLLLSIAARRKRVVF